MPYKDQEKQKEANRLAQAKFKAKGITESNTNQGITGPKAEVKSNTLHPAIVANINRVCTDANGIVDEAKVKVRTAAAKRYTKLYFRPVTVLPPLRATIGHVRVSKPGDEDYVCSKQGQSLCAYCGKPTAYPILRTHLECTMRAQA